MKAFIPMYVRRNSPAATVLTTLFSLGADAVEIAGASCERLVQFKIETATISTATLTRPDFIGPASSFTESIRVNEAFCRS